MFIQVCVQLVYFAIDSEYLVVKQDVEQLRRKQKISRMQRDVSSFAGN